jgi:hypothetical protein
MMIFHSKGVIMSNNLPYFDKSADGNYGSQRYKNRVNRLTKIYQSNEVIISVAQELEIEDQNKAFAAYQKLRAKRKYNTDRDALLYHY